MLLLMMRVMTIQIIAVFHLPHNLLQVSNFSGPLEYQTIWWGHAYFVSKICPPPLIGVVLSNLPKYDEN